MRHQRGLRAHAGAGGRGFAAGMAAADDDDVESRIHRSLECGLLAEAGEERVKNTSVFGGMFHVKQCSQNR